MNNSELKISDLDLNSQLKRVVAPPPALGGPPRGLTFSNSLSRTLVLEFGVSLGSLLFDKIFGARKNLSAIDRRIADIEISKISSC